LEITRNPYNRLSACCPMEITRRCVVVLRLY
jgi:hypothetical protein